MIIYAMLRLFIALAGVAATVCVFSVVAFAYLLALPVAGIVYYATGRWILKRSTQ